MPLTGRAALVAALGSLPVGLLEPGWTGILAVNGSLALACACDFALAAPVRRLVLTRSGDTSTRLGETADITLTVTNPSRRPLRGRLRDAWSPSSWDPGTEVEGSRHRLDIPAGERRRVTSRLSPTRRGDRQADRVTIRSYGPLGLFSRQGTHRVPWSLRVLPPFTSRKHLPSKLARLRELDGRTSVLTRGEGTEFDSLREYVPGDDTRSIDWRATASRAGDRVDLLAYDRQVRALVQGKSAGQLLPSLVTAMATLEPELVETDARGLTAAALRTAPRRSLIVLLTSLDTAPVEEGLLPVLPQLTQRHTVLVASVADPHIARMAQGRGDIDAVYEAAAAAQAQHERQRTAEQLRRHGVTVVDATPEELAPALADAYLALKAAGRL